MAVADGVKLRTHACSARTKKRGTLRVLPWPGLSPTQLTVSKIYDCDAVEARSCVEESTDDKYLGPVAKHLTRPTGRNVQQLIYH